jgi:hypothetical protein
VVDTGAVTRRRLGLGAVLVACLATACAGSGYNYVKSSEDHTYFKVPDSWKLYDENAVFGTAKGKLSAEEIKQRKKSEWITGFDASPKPAIKHVSHSDTAFPTGLAIVQKLSASEADAASLATLRNIFFDVDGTQSGKAATVLTYEPVEFSGGFHGSHLVARLTSGKKEVMVDQRAVLNPSTSKVYAIAVSCTTECYSKYRTKIEKIVDSWTVRDG